MADLDNESAYELPGAGNPAPKKPLVRIRKSINTKTGEIVIHDTSSIPEAAPTVPPRKPVVKPVKKPKVKPVKKPVPKIEEVEDVEEDVDIEEIEEESEPIMVRFRVGFVNLTVPVKNVYIGKSGLILAVQDLDGYNTLIEPDGISSGNPQTVDMVVGTNYDNPQVFDNMVLVDRLFLRDTGTSLAIYLSITGMVQAKAR